MLSNEAKAINEMKELEGFKSVLVYLTDGDPRCVFPLKWIFENYKEWREIFKWFKDNDIRGKRLLEFFQNESPDGGGFHGGITHALSRIKGHKFDYKMIKADQLK